MVTVARWTSYGAIFAIATLYTVTLIWLRLTINKSALSLSLSFIILMVFICVLAFVILLTAMYKINVFCEQLDSKALVKTS